MNTSPFSPDLLAYSKAHNPHPPHHLGVRYKAKGGFLPEPGNTIVQHLVKGSKTQQVLIEARERFLGMPEADKFLFTPVSSLHMTLFQGIIEYRRKPGFWPADLALDASIDDATEIMRGRLAAFPRLEPFEVALIRATPSGLVLEGRTERDQQAMRAWRDAFADCLGYRHPDHDDYVFHITFAYAIHRLSDGVLPAWQTMLDDVVDDIRNRAPVIELTPPAFCVFEDMNHFHELLVFDNNRR